MHGPGVFVFCDPVLLEILARCPVAHVVLAVFDGPVVTDVDAQVAGAGQVRGEAGDAIGDLLVRPRAAGGAGVTADAQDLGGVRPAGPVVGGSADEALLAAAVAFAFLDPGGAREVRVRAGEGAGDLVQQARLVAP